jgi:hypothetical protein
MIRVKGEARLHLNQLYICPLEYINRHIHS